MVSRCAAFFCGLALSVLAVASESRVGGTTPAVQATTELDGVDVVGKKLRQLRREVIEAEDRFYERFNTLNTKDDFDIHCELEKETGTLVPQRRCRIQFLVEAGAIAGEEFHRGLFQGRGVNTPLAALTTQWELRREEYLRTVRALVEKDAALKALAAEWGRRIQQYERASAIP